MSKLINRPLAERDWSPQEISHLLHKYHTRKAPVRREQKRTLIASRPLSRQQKSVPLPDGAVHDSERTNSEGEEFNIADEGPGASDNLNNGAAEYGAAREEEMLNLQDGSNGHVEAAGGVLEVRHQTGARNRARSFKTIEVSGKRQRSLPTADLGRGNGGADAVHEIEAERA